MKIAVTTAALNEEAIIGQVLSAIKKQTRQPDEVVIVNDGSTDKTGQIIKEFSKKNPNIKYIYQEWAGPANARNKAWRNTNSDICVFTDCNCVPKNNWIEELIKPFSDKSVGATGGTYETINTESILARFIGHEIAWKYRNVKGEIEAHGTYNLAVRRKVLEEIGGFNEDYTKPSGEDWDLTYKISKKYKIIYVPTAIVKTKHHPEKFWEYMKYQARRAFDRMKLYNDHPDRTSHDVYTPKIVKYQIVGSGLLLISLPLLIPIFPVSFFIPVSIFIFLLCTTLIPFPYFFKTDPAVAIFSIPVQFVRNFTWLVGMIKGGMTFGFIKIIIGTIKSGM
ncbi:MAG: glycosyltransferase [Patescibacteria group bacterium]|nr:glycosyltransferase [Patescibacteria group bacterium]